MLVVSQTLLSFCLTHRNVLWKHIGRFLRRLREDRSGSRCFYLTFPCEQRGDVPEPPPKPLQDFLREGNGPRFAWLLEPHAFQRQQSLRPGSRLTSSISGWTAIQAADVSAVGSESTASTLRVGTSTRIVPHLCPRRNEQSSMPRCVTCSTGSVGSTMIRRRMLNLLVWIPM